MGRQGRALGRASGCEGRRTYPAGGCLQRVGAHAGERRREEEDLGRRSQRSENRWQQGRLPRWYALGLQQWEQNMCAIAYKRSAQLDRQAEDAALIDGRLLWIDEENG